MCGRRSRLRIHALIVRVPARCLHQHKPFRPGAISSQSRLAPPRRRPTRDGPLRQGRRSRDRPRALRGSQPRLSNIVRRISERLRLERSSKLLAGKVWESWLVQPSSLTSHTMSCPGAFRVQLAPRHRRQHSAKPPMTIRHHCCRLSKCSQNGQVHAAPRRR